MIDYNYDDDDQNSITSIQCYPRSAWIHYSDHLKVDKMGSRPESP